MTRTRWILIGCVAALVVAFGLGAAGGRGILYQAIFHNTATGGADRTAYSKLADIVSVKDFGAVGDGVTDDTAAIQAAITAAAAGSSVLFTPGTYKSGNLTITNKTGLTIQGYGATIQWSGTAPVNQYLGFQLVGTDADISILGLNIVGDAVVANGHAGTWNISGQTLTNIVLRNNHVSNTVVGFTVTADLGGSVNGAIISDNYIYNVVGGSPGQGYGIAVNGGAGQVERIRISNNQIERAQRHSIYLAKGIGVTVSGNQIKDHRLVLAAADSHGSSRAAVNIARSQDVAVIGNVFESPYDTCIATFTDTTDIIKNVTITGNVFKNWHSLYCVMVGGPSTTAYGPFNITVANNMFSEDASVGPDTSENTEGVHVSYGKQVLVSGNDFELTNTTSTAYSIGIEAAGETAGTTTYSDELKFVGNNGSATGGFATMFRLQSAAVASAIRMDFIGNRQTGANNFSLGAAMTDPNVYVVHNAYDGITTSTLAGLMNPNAANNTDAIFFSTNGARLHLGTGAADYLKSDGTSVITGGSLSVTSNISTGGHINATSGKQVLELEGNATDGASVEAVKIANANSLSTTGAKIVGFYPDAFTTEKAFFDKNGSMGMAGVTFANIATGSTVNGTILYCSDCTIANPCASGGTGAFAKRLNGVWVCN